MEKRVARKSFKIGGSMAMYRSTQRVRWTMMHRPTFSAVDGEVHPGAPVAVNTRSLYLRGFHPILNAIEADGLPS